MHIIPISRQRAISRIREEFTKPILNQSFIETRKSNLSEYKENTNNSRVFVISQNVILTKRKYPNNWLSTKKKLFRMKFNNSAQKQEIINAKNKQKQTENLELTDVLTYTKIGHRSHKSKNSSGFYMKKINDLDNKIPENPNENSRNVEITKINAGTDTSFKPYTKYPRKIPSTSHAKKLHNSELENLAFLTSKQWVLSQQNNSSEFYLKINKIKPRKTASRNSQNKTSWNKSFIIQNPNSSYERKPKINMEEENLETEKNNFAYKSQGISNIINASVTPNSRQRNNRSSTLLIKENSRNIPIPQENPALSQNILLKNHLLLQKLKNALVSNPTKTAEIMFKVCFS